MMDHHDRHESNQLVKGDDIVQRRRRMPAHVPYDHGV